MQYPLKPHIVVKVDPATDTKTEAGVIMPGQVLRDWSTPFGGGEVTDGVVTAVYPGCKIPVGVRARFDFKVWKRLWNPQNHKHGHRLSELELLIDEDIELIYWYDGEYHMAKNRILGEPIYENEADVTKNGVVIATELKEKPKLSKIRAIGDCEGVEGLNVGDVAVHTLKKRVKIEVYHTKEYWDLFWAEQVVATADPISDEEVAERLAGRDSFRQKTEEMRPRDVRGMGNNTENDLIRDAEESWSTKGRRKFFLT